MRRLVPTIALTLGLACSAPVSSGLPPLVSCAATSECSAAGAAYQCVDGGCEILACGCDSACPSGLLCARDYGQCLAVDAGTPCDGG